MLMIHSGGKSQKWASTVVRWAETAQNGHSVKNFFYPQCNGTYVQCGSKFCFVVVLLGADTLLKILHYCPILPCFQHIAPLHAPLPGSLARQPCPAALPGSLARQPCPVALPGNLSLQPCPATLPGNLARQPCPAALPGSLAL
jgi:hypothetical protein